MNIARRYIVYCLKCAGIFLLPLFSVVVLFSPFILLRISHDHLGDSWAFVVTMLFTMFVWLPVLIHGIKNSPTDS